MKKYALITAKGTAEFIEKINGIEGDYCIEHFNTTPLTFKDRVIVQYDVVIRMIDDNNCTHGNWLEDTQ